MIEEIVNSANFYAIAKDRHFRYVYCNDNVARAANLDSPSQIIGKTDYDLPWIEQANLYRRGDQRALAGETYMNVTEVQRQSDKIATVLVSKNQLRNKAGKCIGVVVSYVDITGKALLRQEGRLDPNTKKFYLGDTFDNIYLTPCEFQVFKKVLLGHTSELISEALNKSRRTIEDQINKIKHKLQCTSKGEIIEVAFRAGLTHALYHDLDLENIL